MLCLLCFNGVVIEVAMSRGGSFDGLHGSGGYFKFVRLPIDCGLVVVITRKIKKGREEMYM